MRNRRMQNFDSRSRSFPVEDRHAMQGGFDETGSAGKPGGADGDAAPAHALAMLRTDAGEQIVGCGYA